MRRPVRHFFLSDAQVRDGVELDHMRWAGRYIAEKRPDVVICGGDFGDVPSFSVWDQPGSLAGEGKRYRRDKESIWRAMDLLMNPIARCRSYKPKLKLTYGNHEHHIVRMVERDPRFEGTISLADLRYEEYGWTTYPFLQPICVNGVYYCHYFTSGKRGSACTTAAQILRKKHDSCVAGHQQGYDIATGHRADGRRITAIISGSFYLHDEPYMGPQENRHWRGCFMLNEVDDGAFDPMPVSLDYLRRKFGK